MDPSAVSATVVAPIRATVVSIDVAPGDVVHRGQRLIVLESMKMEHVVGGDDERRGHDDRGRRRADRSIPGSDFSPRKEWTCADQTLLREAVPENRLRAYDIRGLIDTLADTGSVLELRPQFGAGIVTSLVRVEGRPLGLVANNPTHLGGAIDTDAADEAARFMPLCDAFDLPILFLCDTPGFLVGPAAERTALVRHVSRLFVVGANVTVPFFTIVLRKGYGLGAQSMAGGSFKAPLFTVAWPTAQFGAMGLEEAAKLGCRRELEAIDDPGQREAVLREIVGKLYERGKALDAATYFEIDDVIDPADSRRWITTALRATPPPIRAGKKRPCIDTW